MQADTLLVEDFFYFVPF